MQRNASWLDSFDFGECDESSFSKKTSSSQENKNEKTENSFSVPTGYAIKKKSNCSLSSLLSACSPQKQSELAVSRQKQNEISKWFQEKVKEGQPSILVISGPSGCGKTQALRVIAKDNSFDIVEWLTPMDQAVDENSKL